MTPARIKLVPTKIQFVFLLLVTVPSSPGTALLLEPASSVMTPPTMKTPPPMRTHSPVVYLLWVPGVTSSVILSPFDVSSRKLRDSFRPAPTMRYSSVEDSD